MSITGDSGIPFGRNNAIPAEMGSSSSGKNTSGGAIATDSSFTQVTPNQTTQEAPTMETPTLRTPRTPTQLALEAPQTPTPMALEDQPPSRRNSRQDRSRSSTPRRSEAPLPPVRSLLDGTPEQNDAQVEIIRNLRATIRQRNIALAELQS